MTWRFPGLDPGAYRVILVDPPWRFLTFNDANQSKKPERHYRTMGFEAIAALPVGALAHPEGAALVVWTTAPFLDRALELVKDWGFTFRTAGVWPKLSKTGRRIAFGTGYLLRGAVEFFLVATRGRIAKRLSRGARAVRNLLGGADLIGRLGWMVVAPVREHSRKPDEMHAALETLFPGPYAELFARQRREGWDAWGDQTEKFR